MTTGQGALRVCTLPSDRRLSFPSVKVHEHIAAGLEEPVNVAAACEAIGGGVVFYGSAVELRAAIGSATVREMIDSCRIDVRAGPLGQRQCRSAYRDRRDYERC